MPRERLLSGAVPRKRLNNYRTRENRLVAALTGWGR